MKVAMLDPSLFTGRYDDSLCAALAGQGAQVTLLGRPMRATDAIVPHGYAYAPISSAAAKRCAIAWAKAAPFAWQRPQNMA